MDPMQRTIERVNGSPDESPDESSDDGSRVHSKQRSNRGSGARNEPRGTGRPTDRSWIRFAFPGMTFLACLGLVGFGFNGRRSVLSPKHMSRLLKRPRSSLRA